MKALYKYENGKKFMGIVNDEVKAIEALFEMYANKKFYNNVNYWWKDVEGRCFVIEDAKVWGE